jgi:peptidyl-prolyl cis-trans isomerase D
MRLKGQERQLDYAKIALPTVAQAFTDAEINAYFERHRQEFRSPERVSIEYLALGLNDLAKDIQVGDEELQKLYEEQKAGYGTPERRKISHILIPLDGTDEAADRRAQDKANAVRERLVQGEDFAKLAQELSSDTVSGKKGGDLGYLESGAQEETFTKAAEALKAGEVSAPVKTSFGYHLIKLTEWVPARIRPFDEVREELRQATQRNRAETAFYEKGQKLAEITFEHPGSLEQAAQQLGLQVQQTGLFTRDAGEGLATEEAIRKAAFSEDVLGGRNSDPVELGNEKAVVLRVREHQAAADKPLAEVRDEILARLRDEAARKLAQSQSQQLLKQLREGKSLDEAAKSSGLTAVHAGFIRRDNDQLPAELVRAAFTAARPAPGVVTPGEVALADGSIFVYAIPSVKDGPVAASDLKEQESAGQFLLRSGGQQEFGAFVERLRELADVKIEQKD